MSDRDMPADLADRLLDAHVRYVLAAIGGTDRDEHVEQIVGDLWKLGGSLTLREVLDVDEVERVVRRVLTTVPPSDAATILSQGAAEVLHAGPERPFSPGDVIAQEDIERAVDELVRAQPLIRKALDEVVESPLIAAVVSRFVSRIVGDVVASNRAAAERIPGIGGLVSFGAGAASKVMGAGANGVEQLLGDTAGKGAQIVARRLNRIAVDTLQDPQFKAGLLQLWDERSDARIEGLSRIASLDDTRRVIALVHDIAVGAFGSEPIGELASRLVRMLFATYGDSPVTVVLTELGLTQEDMTLDAQRAVTHLIGSADADDRLEPFVRARLAPFYASAEFREALSES